MVGAQSHYKVVLKEDTEVLDEVVVVGYGVKQKRSTMTTAISKMDSKVLENAAIANAAQALQGSVSGLRVTNTSGAPVVRLLLCYVVRSVLNLLEVRWW